MQEPIPGATELERLVNRSRLIGSQPELVVHGGGNTSSKISERDHAGRERLILRIKGSGSDLKTITPRDFPGLYMDELLPLRSRAAMTDQEMVSYLACCMVDPQAPRPSIETLLHAFLPARHVDHVHADAICALVNQPDSVTAVREALGPDVALVSYVRPGFELSRRVGELASSRAVVLDKHGLVTWGDTHEESYERTLELVDRARSFLQKRTKSKTLHSVPDLSERDVSGLLVKLRGRLSRGARRVLLTDRSQRELADRPDVEQVAAAARATPDHILRIGPRSVVIRSANDVSAVVDAYESAYRAYFERHRERLPDGLSMLDPCPRSVLVPGLGCIASGADAKGCRVVADVSRRSHTVVAQGLDAGLDIAWLNESEIFDFDYWPMELHKLKSAPPPPPLAGSIVLLAPLPGVDGEQVAAYLSKLGAHLVLVADDTDRTPLIGSLPAERTIAVNATVAEPAGAQLALHSAVAAFGGLDGVIECGNSTRTSDELFRGASEIFEQQGIGGSLVRLRSNKDGKNSGPQFVLPGGVRLNQIVMDDGGMPSGLPSLVAFLLSDGAGGLSDCVLPLKSSQAG